MRISDWSSDVCSSDLSGPALASPAPTKMEPLHLVLVPLRLSLWQRPRRTLRREPCPDREDARGHPQLSSIWMQAPERPGPPRRCVGSAGEQDPPADLPRTRT